MSEVPEMAEAPEFEPVAAPASVSVRRKTTADIYTTLLIITLVALLLGCVFLWAEISTHGGFGKVNRAITMHWPSGGSTIVQHGLA